VDIVETVAGSVTSTKQFVWCGNQICEARNASGSITAQYFSWGETISGSNYYYSRDRLGSIREMTNSSGAIQAEYTYDPYGRTSAILGTVSSDLQYAGYYTHAPSGLNLTLTRFYSSQLARWISRDSIGEKGGVNLYAYVENNPLSQLDPAGEFPGTPFHSIDLPSCLANAVIKEYKCVNDCLKPGKCLTEEAKTQCLGTCVLHFILDNLNCWTNWGWQEYGDYLAGASQTFFGPPKNQPPRIQ